MSELHQIIREIEEYSEAVHSTPASVCRAATNNPRLFERLKRRAARVDADLEALRKYMSENPIVREAAE